MPVITLFERKMNDVMKMIKFLEESGRKDASEAIRNEAKGQKDVFLGMLFVTLGASLLRNPLTGEGVIQVGEGAITMSQEQGAIRAR